MSRIFQVAEADLQKYLDVALRSGGLAMHKVTQDLVSVLKEVTPPAEPLVQGDQSAEPK